MRWWVTREGKVVGGGSEGDGGLMPVFIRVFGLISTSAARAGDRSGSGDVLISSPLRQLRSREVFVGMTHQKSPSSFLPCLLPQSLLPLCDNCPIHSETPDRLISTVNVRSPCKKKVAILGTNVPRSGLEPDLTEFVVRISIFYRR